MKLCFDGLRTFIVEFLIVFSAFSAFFYFMLKNDLENFRDFIRSLENTVREDGGGGRRACTPDQSRG